jgi:hypothetical protein
MWHKRNMTREICAHALQLEHNFPCYLNTSNARQAWFIGAMFASRAKLGGTVKRPVGKCIVPVTLLHGTNVANLHFFLLKS